MSFYEKIMEVSSLNELVKISEAAVEEADQDALKYASAIVVPLALKTKNPSFVLLLHYLLTDTEPVPPADQEELDKRTLGLVKALALHIEAKPEVKGKSAFLKAVTATLMVTEGMGAIDDLQETRG